MRQPDLAIRVESWSSLRRADVLFVPALIRRGKPDLHSFHLPHAPLDARLRELASSYGAPKQAGSIDDLILPAGAPWGRLAIVSLGDEKPARPHDVRNAAGAVIQWCNRHRASKAASALDALHAAAGDGGAASWAEGAVLGSFRYLEQRSRPPEDDNLVLAELSFLCRSRPTAGLTNAVDRARVLAECVNLARLIAHEPPNIINPVTLARRAAQIARRHRLRCRVLDDRQMRARKMGAILAVGGGSASKARMIILEHPGPSPRERPIVLVGKAVTLDTGGYSIKPSASIPEMKYDKCGGMAVLGALVAASRLKLRRRIVGVIGAAENMISGEAYRPGDIIRAASGKTVEILDTDAEGRLVLADCLYHAEKTYRPRAMIDLATLTGACTVALGDVCAGLMSTNDALAAALTDSGERTGERLWRLPLWPAYREQIAGADADLKNVGGRNGGCITAGMFLKEFVSDKTPWAHLDIAGVAATTKALPTCPIGATGFGVRLLVDYIERLA